MIGQANVLRRGDDKPARNEPRIFSCAQHPSQPVQRSVGVAAPNALDKRADDVVVLVSAIAQRLQICGGFGISQNNVRHRIAALISGRR